MDKVTFKMIYQAIATAFGLFTVGFLYVAYYATEVGYDHPAIFFMVGLAACITCALSITLFVVAMRTKN